MLDVDDIDPVRRTLKPRDLEPMSLEALSEYIISLESEIDRARQMITRKQSQQSLAQSLFKS